MAVTKDEIMTALARLTLPAGDDLVSRDMIRALNIEGGAVRFVIEAADPGEAARMDGVRRAAEQMVASLPGVDTASAILTAHGPAAKAPEPPSLKVGRHPTPQAGPSRPTGVGRILAIGSGKGGVGKSTVSSNLSLIHI